VLILLHILTLSREFNVQLGLHYVGTSDANIPDEVMLRHEIGSYFIHNCTKCTFVLFICFL
jgi:hypothetical protein